MNSRRNLLPSFGISWWGWSPCNNLIQELVDIWKQEDLPTSSNSDVINVLLIGANDPRHILKTVAEQHTWGNNIRKLNIFIIEQTLEQLTRQCLLLALALDTSDRSSLHEKSMAYLEIFGNSLLSSTTYEYLQKYSKTLIDLIADVSNPKNNLEIIKFEELKHKEKDAMEAAMKFWSGQNNDSFPISHLWDLRLRHCLGDRYDSRTNIFDWDYHMNLRSRGCLNITAEEYIQWRESGIAFKFQECTIPNRTLASTRIQSPEKKEYFGDIITGPFVAFGVESNDKDVFKTENNKPVKTSQDVSFTNVSKFLQQIHDNAAIRNRVEIQLLSPDSIFKLHARERYSKKFHLVYFSRNTIQVMNSHFNKILTTNGTILTETSRFDIGRRKEEIEDIQNQIDDILKLAHYKAVGHCNALQESHASFIQNTAL